MTTILAFAGLTFSHFRSVAKMVFNSTIHQKLSVIVCFIYFVHLFTIKKRAPEGARLSVTAVAVAKAELRLVG